MTTPDARRPAGAAMWGGVRDDIQNGTDFTAACAAARQRRRARKTGGGSSRRPRRGSAPSCTWSSLPRTLGRAARPSWVRGYTLEAPAAPEQVQADHGSLVYGVRPVYADDVVGGFGFLAGRGEAPIRRHVHNLGADGLFIEGASAPAADGFTVVSAPSRPSLLSRLLGRFRRPR